MLKTSHTLYPVLMMMKMMMMMMMKSSIAQSLHAIVACSVRSVG